MSSGFNIRKRAIPPAPVGGDVRKSERGHLMAAVIAMTAVLAILSTVAVQEWSELKRRDDEAEMIFRARDLARSIARYRADKGGTQPLTDLEMLLEPGTKGQYFVRQLWEDPLTKDGKWGLLYQGPGGQIIDPNAPEGLPGDFRLGETTFGNTVGSPDQSALNNPEQSGLPIIGVRSLATGQPFREIDGMSDYSQWKFTIFDVVPGLQNQQRAPGGGNPGAQPGNQNRNPGGSSAPGNSARPGSRPGASQGAGQGGPRRGGGRTPGQPRRGN